MRVLAALGVMAALALAGCAGTGGGLFSSSPNGPGTVRTAAGERLGAEDAQARVVAGQSRKAEVQAALGQALVVPFDSGREVWVYRWPGGDGTPRGATELVLLFDAEGVLSQSRVKPGYPPR